jgi:hypothetical protein
MRKKNQPGPPLKGIFWFSLAIVCLCSVVLFADYLEKVGGLEIISCHVEAMIVGF